MNPPNAPSEGNLGTRQTRHERRQSEPQRITIGSFLTSDDPHDLDIAVFQDSDESSYPLAMKYRRTFRPIANRIPLDVIPIRRSPVEGPFMQEIQRGEVLYER